MYPFTDKVVTKIAALFRRDGVVLEHMIYSLIKLFHIIAGIC